MDCVYLKRAEYLGDYKVFLEFNDGKKGSVDCKDIIDKYPIAAPLKNSKAFSAFYLDTWPTLAWKCGFDIAPETLHEICEQVHPRDASRP